MESLDAILKFQEIRAIIPGDLRLAKKEEGRPRRGWRHAFAVDTPAEFQPTDEQRRVADGICRELVRRRLTTPALMFLEMSRPLNFLGSQLLHFLSPVLSGLTQSHGHRHLAAFLEHRGSVDYLCRRIEELDSAGK